MTDDDLFLRAAALKTISEFTEARYQEARVEVAQAMGAGDKKTVRSPLDGKTKLGIVYMTDPKPRVAVTDGAALRDWVADHYPERIASSYEISGTDREVVDVLFAHAPHLLREVRVVKPDVVREIKASSLSMGCPLGPGGELDVPGIEIQTPDPVAVCKPDEDAELAIYELHAAGRLGLDGTMRPALEASDGR